MFSAILDNQPTFFLSTVLLDQSKSVSTIIARHSINNNPHLSNFPFRKNLVSNLPDCKSYDHYHSHHNHNKLTRLMPLLEVTRVQKELIKALEPLGKSEKSKRGPSAESLNSFFTIEELNLATSKIFIDHLNATLLPTPNYISS